MSKRKKQKPDPDMLFGDLRAIVQQPLISDGQRLNLWNLCDRMHRYYPHHYTTQWIPYLKSYASVWQPERVVVRSHDDLEHALELAPFGRFTLAPKNPNGAYSLGASARQNDKLHHSRLLAHIAALDVSDVNIFSMLWKSPHLTRVERIRLHGITHGSPLDLLLTLCTSSSKDTLHTVHIHGEDYSQRHDPLLDDTLNKHLPSLRELEIAHITMPREHVSRLLSWDRLLNPLHHFALAHVGLSEFDLAMLGERREPLDALESLDLSGMARVTSKAHALTRALDHMPNLTHLSIRDSFTQFRPIALATYLAERADSRLEALDLSGSNVGVRALQVLSKSHHLTHLHTLGLSRIPLDAQVVKLLSSHPFFARLHTLLIEPTQLTAERAEQLATSATLDPQLTRKFASWHERLHTWPNP